MLFLWAVHIADGVLGWPWLLAGFVVSGLLCLVAAWRVREEEIPRIALLCAAFFAASSIHVKLGQSSVHLLLGGLVGVILGWRAPLAILLGVALQALLIPHGGLTTIGVNAAAQMVPALFAALLYPWLRRWPGTLLAAIGGLLWIDGLLLALGVLLYCPWHQLVRFSSDAGLVLQFENLSAALTLLLHPVGLGAQLLFVAGCVILQRRAQTSPEFPAGALVGMLSVLGTTALVCLVLLADGAERWQTLASALFLAHLPLALIEGLIVGTTVSFLTRVKPQMLGETRTPVAVSPALTVLVLAGWLGVTPAVQAHLLEAEAKVNIPKKTVVVNCWYETGDAPEGGQAKVLREDGSVLIEGLLDKKGAFTFTYEEAVPLRVQLSAPGGHRAQVRLTANQLGKVEETPVRTQSDEGRSRWRDLLLGVTFLLALAAFVLSWRNAQKLHSLNVRNDGVPRNSTSVSM